MVKMTEGATPPAYVGVRRLYQLFGKCFIDEAGRDGITLEQYLVALTLKGGRALTQTRIVELSGFDRSTVSQIKSGLKHRGLVTENIPENDARAKLIALTNEGAKTLKATEKAYLAAEIQFQLILGENKLVRLFDLLRAAGTIPHEPIDRKRH